MTVGLEIQYEVRGPTKYKLRRINPLEDEAMKYNTTEFSGDALREAVDQYGPSSPATGTPETPTPGRHAAPGTDERKSTALQANRGEDDHNLPNGEPADESHSAERTAPVTPTSTAAAATSDVDVAHAAEQQPTDSPAPPAPVDINSRDTLLAGSSHDAHSAMTAAQTLDTGAHPEQQPAPAAPQPPAPNTGGFPLPATPPPAAPTFTQPLTPHAPNTGSSPLPAAPTPTYRARPQQRTPDAWDHADEPTQLGIRIPDQPTWAEQSPAHPAAPALPAHPPAAPGFGSRGPARLTQDGQTQQLPQVQPSAPPHAGYTTPNHGAYTGPEYSSAPQAPRPLAPNNFHQPNPAQQRPVGQQQPSYGNPDLTAGRRPPAPPQTLLPSPPPPPNLSSEKTDHAFVLESRRKEGPSQGWRGALNRIHIPVRKSVAEQAFDNDIATINRTFRYSKTIGIAAFKGGVGKTTCALCLASTVAEHRTKGEVAAVDTDDRGSLARRVHGEQTSDIKRFAYDPDLQTPNEVKSHMMSNSHRLGVLGSSQSPQANALSPEEYARAQQILQNNHLFVFVDMDTSAASPAYETIMHSLDALVLVTSTAIDSAEAGRSMREWLRARNLHDLAAHTLVLINHQSPAKPFLDLENTANYYRNEQGCPVLEIPWDPHLAEASSVNLDLLDKGTRRQFVKASATLIGMLPPA